MESRIRNSRISPPPVPFLHATGFFLSDMGFSIRVKGFWYDLDMSQALAAEPIPLYLDADKVIRVAGTRVTLETVIETFKTGATPEEIARDFSALQLDDVYAVITYYLRHREEVESYLAKRLAEADEIRKKIGARFDQTGLKERLRTRLAR